MIAITIINIIIGATAREVKLGQGSYGSVSSAPRSPARECCSLRSVTSITASITMIIICIIIILLFVVCYYYHCYE